MRRVLVFDWDDSVEPDGLRLIESIWVGRYLGLVPCGGRGRERLQHVGEEAGGLEDIVDEAREGADGRGVEDAGLGGGDADAAARHQVQHRAGAGVCVWFG